MSAFRVLHVVVLATLAALGAASDALAQTGQQIYTSWCQGCHSFPGNNHNNVLRGKDWTVIKLAIQTKVEMRIELLPVYNAGLLDDGDLMLIAGYLQTFPGGDPAPPVATVVPVIEYFNAGFGHYFMSADADEIAGLDAGAFGGAFARTGRQFNGWNLPTTATLPVCRFFTVTFAPKSSHFYTADPVECEGVKLNVDWQYEKIAFHVAVPEGGVCAPGTVPIYRMFNNGQTGAPNHRFTTDLALYQAFTTTQNWSAEGIAFCAPP